METRLTDQLAMDFWYENASDERNETPKGNNRLIRTTLLTVSDLDETNRKSHHSIIYQFVTNNGKN